MADDSQQQSTSNPAGTNSNSPTLPVVFQEKICVEKLASISNVESLDVGTELADSSHPDTAVPADDDCNSCGDSDGPPTPSSADWKPISPSVTFVQEMLDEGVNPREILRQLLPNTELPPDLPNSIMLHVIAQLLSEPPKREKLPQYNTLDDVVDLLRRSTNILVLTGAGVSVSCGIPDFRSKDGIYARLHSDFPDLPDPQAMFDIDYFRKNPRPFFDFAQEIYPGQFRPSPSHRFIKSLEDAGKLLRNYTQNIDTLEQVAGISNIVQCHGSFANASCCVCKHQVSCDDIREDIFAKRVPHCLKCPPEDIKAVMKPDIVFFGEDLPSQFHQQITADKDKVDLLIVIGSSLKVRPVALIPSSIPPEVPQVLINREPLSHCTMDVELLGNCDDIISELCLRLGGDEWTKVPPAGTSLLQR
uniref:NAD-dependent protein deacetylase sir-2.1 n=2 Tax=Plectus sambesii TaxID=2011161 RepID=A0A914WIK0_9BILA